MSTTTLVVLAVAGGVTAGAGVFGGWLAKRVGAWLAALLAALVEIASLPEAVRELLAEFRIARTDIDALTRRVDRIEGV